MFLLASWLALAASSFPRIRGDVPDAVYNARCAMRFSPHTRGCSERYLVPWGGDEVFPAYAGMFLDDGGHPIFSAGFPRIRGDVPVFLKVSSKN